MLAPHPRRRSCSVQILARTPPIPGKQEYMYCIHKHVCMHASSVPVNKVQFFVYICDACATSCASSHALVKLVRLICDLFWSKNKLQYLQTNTARRPSHGHPFVFIFPSEAILGHLRGVESEYAR